MQRSADVAAGVLAEVLARQPMTPGKLSFAWRAAVGPALARATTADLRDGRIVIRASSDAWKREIERSRPVILERLRALLGRAAVRGLEIEL